MPTVGRGVCCGEGCTFSVTEAADLDACYEMNKGVKRLCIEIILYPCGFFSSGVFCLGDQC